VVASGDRSYGVKFRHRDLYIFLLCIACRFDIGIATYPSEKRWVEAGQQHFIVIVRSEVVGVDEITGRIERIVPGLSTIHSDVMTCELIEREDYEAEALLPIRPRAYVVYDYAPYITW